MIRTAWFGPAPTGNTAARPGRTIRPGLFKEELVNATVLWIIAAILVIVGIVQLLQGQIIFGIVLIVLGLLVGPGGVSIFNRRA